MAGTDVRVSSVLEALAETGSVAAVVERFPALTRADVAAALRFAAGSVRGPAEYGAGAGSARKVREAAVAYGGTDFDREIFRLEQRLAVLGEEAGLLRAVRAGLDDVRTGNLVPHEQAMAELAAAVGL